jgi:hypothetical protein
MRRKGFKKFSPQPGTISFPAQTADAVRSPAGESRPNAKEGP